MSVISSTPSVNGAKNEASIFLSEKFIKEIWVHLAGQIPREHICQIATEVASEYQDVKITTFLPIVIRRHTLERLKATSQEGE